MKKIININKSIAVRLLCVALLTSTFPSCNFLDIVPDEADSEESAFKDVLALERYLYSCYSYIPFSRHATASMDLMTSDDLITPVQRETFATFAIGNYSASNIENQLSPWPNVYGGVKQCLLLLDNIDNVPGVTEGILRSYKGQATFLIAYYHSLGLRAYGPIIIMDKQFPLTTPVADYPARNTYDEGVNFVVNKLDEAIALGLPERYSEGKYVGLATVAVAKALKARVLLYAASPLFNGAKANYTPYTGGSYPRINMTTQTDDLTDFYAGMVNADGQPLMNTTYDASKWQRAATAAKEAIEAAEAQGARLFVATDGNWAGTVNHPANLIERQLRMALPERKSPERIWTDARTDGEAFGLQDKSAPNGMTPRDQYAYGLLAPTLNMVETFLTENGLPIDNDPAFDFNGRYDIVPSTETGNDHRQTIGGTVRALTNTLALNLGREPRFRAWISYHNSYYEYNTAGANGRIAMGFRRNDFGGIKGNTENYSLTGYLNKKGVNPLNSWGVTSGGTRNSHPWTMIRLGEMYLTYAEALIEVGGADNFNTAVDYINRIRTRAGIPTVEDAWGGIPDQATLRQIVRQERTIELYMENHRFWDIRRWLLGTKYYADTPRGMNILADDNTFFEIKDITSVERAWHVRNYLLPIATSELNKHPGLVQNAGY